LESLADGGLPGVITTASEARASGCDRLPRAVPGQDGSGQHLAGLADHSPVAEGLPRRRELLRKLPELLLGGRAGVEELVLELQLAADGGTGLRQSLGDAADGLARRTRRLHQHDPLASQQLPQQQRGRSLGELVIAGELTPLLPVDGDHRVDLLPLLL
jgi:hypothetical protein